MTDNLPVERKPQISTGGMVAALVPQNLDETYRLAAAMAQSGMMPNNIKTPEAVMVAVMAGAELGFPPFQAVQSFAVINGRPSLFGDAVPALLLSRGFDIDEVYENEDPAYPDNMKAVCTVTRPNGKQITRSFSVADAKEGQLWNKSGPWQTARKRMLLMRARSYAARDGAADVLRGFVLVEEAQDYTVSNDAQPTGTGMRERLESRATEVDVQGFNVRQITEETAAAAPKRRGRPPKAAAEPEAIEPEAVEVLDGDDVPAEFTDRPMQTASAPSVEVEQDLSDSATDVSDDTQAGASGITDEPRRTYTQDVIAEGYPERDEVYHLNGDAWGEDDGRRDTYKNGEPFSSARRETGHKIYEDHASEALPPPSTFPPEFDAYIDSVNNAKCWKDVIGAIQTFWATGVFKGMTPAQQNKVRANSWDTMADELQLPDLPDPAQNASAYRLWIESNEDTDVISFTLAVLEKEGAFQAKPDEFKKAIRDAAAARIAILKA